MNTNQSSLPQIERIRVEKVFKFAEYNIDSFIFDSFVKFTNNLHLTLNATRDTE